VSFQIVLLALREVLMNKINDFENAILLAILDDNSIRFPFLKDHYPYLYVASRELTGVGLYSNFGYLENNLTPNDTNANLGSHKRFIVKGFENELSYELNITHGKINFLELVTNGNDTFNEIDQISNFKLE
jgi:hypothetical protein